MSLSRVILPFISLVSQESEGQTSGALEKPTVCCGFFFTRAESCPFPVHHTVNIFLPHVQKKIYSDGKTKGYYLFYQKIYGVFHTKNLCLPWFSSVMSPCFYILQEFQMTKTLFGKYLKRKLENVLLSYYLWNSWAGWTANQQQGVRGQLSQASHIEKKHFFLQMFIKIKAKIHWPPLNYTSGLCVCMSKLLLFTKPSHPHLFLFSWLFLTLLVIPVGYKW